MMIHELKPGKRASSKPTKRLGRGESSGQGKTGGHGHKGSGQRAGSIGSKMKEGGRLPFFRRIPKRGFNNAAFGTVYQVVNVGTIDKEFAVGDVVDPMALEAKGLITSGTGLVKVLGTGVLGKGLTIKAHKFSESAAEKIKASGGTAETL
jgi:large subunit ribosomal protein L15